MLNIDSRLAHHSVVIVIVLAALWLRVGDLASLPPGLSSDESMNANDAFHIAQVGPARFPFYENYGEPEPLFRFILAAFVPFFGPHIWTFRLVSALAGVITVVAAYWTAQQVLVGQSLDRRWTASAVAAASLATAIGYITLTRSLYRAAPLPLSILLFVGFLLRGLRRKQRGDIALSGFCLAIGCYIYTAGFVVPLALGPFALGLLLFERKSWKFWTSSFAVIGAITAIVLIPVGRLLIQNPERVLGRAAEVTATSVDTTTSAITSITGRALNGSSSLLRNGYTVLFVQGDINPQYNSAQAPVIPPVFQPFFALGMLVLLWRWRCPQSWLLLPLILVTIAPAAMSGEPLHGLRITGAFAIFPLIVGLGAGGAGRLISRLTGHWQLVIDLGAVAVMVSGVWWARQTYAGYWQNPPTLTMYNHDLDYGEWFFRPDQRDLAQWIRAQSRPILVPLDQLLLQTTRAWLLPSYPEVVAADDTFSVPPDTIVVFPWALEIGDYDVSAMHYALLQNHTISLLPPLTEGTHSALVANLESAQLIDRPNGNPMAMIVTPGLGFKFDFESPQVAATLDQPIAALANGLLVTGWWGPASVSRDSEQTVTYMLDWATRRPVQHDYRSFVGLLTIDNDRKAGVDADMTRWLYPTWTWRPDTPTPVTYTFTVPAGLDPGAYRLAVIMESELTTIGWVKVPQADPPSPTAGNVHAGALFNNEFVLYGASAKDEGNGNMRLSFFWQSDVERPLTDAIIFIHAQTRDGQLIAQTDAQPWQGQYPTFIWSQGERVQTDYVLNIGSTPPANLEIWVGMYTFPSLERLSVTQDGVPVKDNRLRVGSLIELLGR